MKRYRGKSVLDISEHKDGEFVLYADVLECMEVMIMYTLRYKDEIDDEVDDFGHLKPILDMIRGQGKAH